MADRQYVVPEVIVPGHRKGRHVNHDPRSLRYLVPARAVTPKTVTWQRHIPVLDQGNLGSCTANATVGVLGSSPYYETLPASVQTALNEDYAVQLYRDITRTDPFPGAWEPDDTGSDGLSAAKTAKARGLISGYQHITSIAAAHAAIQAGPFIAGTAWLADMENPDSRGVVRATGAELGGHEYECFGYDLAADLWWFWNSWGPSWGKAGAFAMSTADFAKLLADQGDATPFVPLTQPAPVPTPAPPAPAPAPTPEPGPNAFPAAAYESFRAHPYSIAKRKAFVAACDAWLGRS